MLIAGLLPLLAWACLWLAVGNSRLGGGWERAALRASVMWGAWLVLVTEVLSALDILVSPSLWIVWCVPSAGALLWLLLRRRAGDALRLPIPRSPVGWREWLPLGIVLTIVGVTAWVAWVTPPQTWDALHYHMPRVAHWAQNGSVAPYATGIEVQNSRSPGAEFIVLHFYILMGGDRLATLVEWFAMVGSLVAVWVLAGQLGGGRAGRWLATVFVAALPMGIVQASSTMTDYVTAFWVAVMAVEVLNVCRERAGWTAIVFGGVAAGLSLLTKPTSAPIVVVALLIEMICLLRIAGWRRTLGPAVVSAVIVLAMNAPFLLRNVTVYGDPISGGDQLEVHANPFYDPRAVASNILRNAGMQLGTPSPHVNKAIYLSIAAVHQAMGIDLNDPRTTAHSDFKVDTPTTSENLATNPLHAWLLLLCIPAGIVLRRRIDRVVLWYALAWLGAFVLFSAIFQWQIFGSRYHMPFFVLAGPVFGVLAAAVPGRAVAPALSLALFLGSIPWLVNIHSRPLIPMGVDRKTPSILTTPRQHLRYVNAEHLRWPFGKMAEILDQSGCKQVGIALGGAEAEYLLWAALGLPNSDYRLEWLVVGTPSAAFRSPDFAPCAVVCQFCPESWATSAGMTQVFKAGKYRLLLRDVPGATGWEQNRSPAPESTARLLQETHRD